MRSISIIGVGRVGGALAIALSRAGFAIDNLIYRSPDTSRQVLPFLAYPPPLIESASLKAINSDVLIITSADPDIAGIAAQVAAIDVRPRTVLHTSGSLSSDILEELSKAGCRTGSMHPLVSISGPVVGAERFKGAFFCIEGDAADTAAEIVEALGGHPFSIPTADKSLYHAAAVTASGHLVAVIDVAIEMLSECGLDEDKSREILLPLIESTVANLKSQNTAGALTGSFARADVAAVKRHLGAMGTRVSTRARGAYLELGERSIEIAESCNADPQRLAQIRELISLAKKNSG